jgi:LuxR family maltose regulon positive regulatory protein
LERGANARHLCVLSAPAGFGKSTTVVHWLETEERPYAWLTLEKADNDPERFWQHVVAALRTLWPDVGSDVDIETAVRAHATPFLDDFIDSIVRLDAGYPNRTLDDTDRPSALVLDDYHVIHRQDIHQGIEYLLDHLPPHLVLVVATRTDPPLSLPRRRVQGLLTELRASNLRFDTAESRIFLNEVMSLSLSDPDIHALNKRTEGWIASLYLAALSLQKHNNPTGFIEAFAGSDRHLVDYLMEEVLTQQTEPVRRFLLASAVTDRFCAPLCDALLAQWPDAQGSSVSFLEHLERENLFLVPLDETRRWYRYHALFADLLRMRLHRDHSSVVPRLHLRASRWFEDQGLVDEAIRHSIEAGHLERAAILIEKEGMTLITRFGRPVPERWLQAIPGTAEQDRPMLAIVHAWSLLIRQPMLLADPEDLSVIEARLSQAERAMHRGGHDAPLKADVRAHINMARAHLARFRGNVDEAIRRSERELDRLPREPSLFRGGTAFNLGLAHLVAQDTEKAVEIFKEAERDVPEDVTYVRVGITYMRGLVLYHRGRLHEAHALYDKTLHSLQPPGPPDSFPSYGGSHFIGRGRVLYEWNRLEEAAAQLETGIIHVRRSGDPLIECNGRAYLARTWSALGKASQSRAEVDAIRCRLPTAEPLARALEMDLQLEMLSPEHSGGSLSRWVEESRSQFERVTARGEWRFEEWLARGRWLVAQRAPELKDADISTLTTTLAEHVDTNQAGGWSYRALRVLLVLAVAYEAVNAQDAAQSTIDQALRIAAQAGYTRVFVAERQLMARLLYRYLEKASGAANEYRDERVVAHAARVLAAFPDATSPPLSQAGSSTTSVETNAQLIEPLTPRETEVLQLIAQGLTNQEIADQLFISYETVKVHARNIYGKLDVNSRTKAVAQARWLGVLSS